MEIRKKLEEGIELYNKLENANKKTECNFAAIRKTYTKIKKFNKWLEEDYIISMLASFSNKTEYEVQKNIYEECKTTQDEIKLIVENGKKMIEDYMKNIPLLVENIELVEKEKIYE